MTRLFGRRYMLTIGDMQITGLDVRFEVTRTLRAKPNEARIDIYNLSAATLGRIEGLRDPLVRLEAGYQNETQSIFLGTPRTIETERSGPDLVTTIHARDGGSRHQTARRRQSFSPGEETDRVLAAAARSYGRGSDESPDFVRSARKIAAAGLVIDGRLARELDWLTRDHGAEMSIQDERAVLLQRGRALQGTALRLAPETGLVGSPKRSKKIVKARTLMIPDLFPGRSVVFDTERVGGTYRVDQAKYLGDFGGQDWYVDITCKEPTS